VLVPEGVMEAGVAGNEVTTCGAACVQLIASAKATDAASARMGQAMR
jgi:hypothetical protein